MTKELLLSHLPKDVLEGGIEETVSRFASQLLTVEDPFLNLHELKVLIGEEAHPIIPSRNEMTGLPRYTKSTEFRECYYRCLPEHIENIDNIIQLYQMDSFDPSAFQNIDYSATQKYRPNARGQNFLFHNEQPIDNLVLLTRKRPYFVNIAKVGSTPLFNLIERTIRSIWQQAAIIEEGILADEKFKRYNSMSNRKELQTAYHKQEYLRKDEVIPLLEEMKLVYQTGAKIIQCVSKQYPDPAVLAKG